MGISQEGFQLHAIRGAITAKKNSKKEIEYAVNELVNELLLRNSLDPARIISITFSATNDINACFPASIARKHEGWENIALLDCQHLYVENDLPLCIRFLAHVWLPKEQRPFHPYLKEARSLRPDR